jgi:SHS2 domain-containing protein
MDDFQFEERNHTADWEIRVKAPDLARLLQGAVFAMHHMSGVVLGDGEPQVRDLQLAAGDPESLLVDWLEEHLIWIELEGLAAFDMAFDRLFETEISARVSLRPLRQIDKPIKAVTYHNLELQKGPQGFSATIVFDV